MILTPEVKDALNQLMLLILTGLTTVVIPMVYRIGKAWADAKIAAARAKVAQIEDQKEKDAAEAKLRLIEYAYTRLDHIVGNTVKEISQTAGLQTGLSNDEKQRRLDQAIMNIKRQLPRDLEDTLRGVVNDFDRYLVTKVEATRFDQKQAKPRTVLLQVPAGTTVGKSKVA